MSIKSMSTKSKASQHILQGAPLLKELLSKAHLIEEMNAIVVPLLPLECQPYCKVANIREHALIISVSNQHVITTLRFIIPELLNTLQSYPLFAKITAIKTKIIFTETKTKSAPLKTAVLSTKQRKILEQLKGFLKST